MLAPVSSILILAGKSIICPNLYLFAAARRIVPQYRMLFLVMLFALALSPLASTYLVHHPDERHYTDGAISMLSSGDWLTPHKPDGTPRFCKPGVPYWLVAASYRAFGIGVLTSRLPFLLAGCALIWVTYHLAMLVTESQRAAQMAALISMTNPLLILSSVRSIPDILLSLFLTISAYGFAGLLFKGKTTRFAMCAYVGAGLAIASKGLPGVAFVLFVWLLAAVGQKSWRAVGRLWHAPSVALGGAIGCAWFVAIFTAHQADAVNGFWSDQVSERFALELGKSAWQFSLVWFTCAAIFLPWWIHAAIGWIWQQKPLAGDQERRRQLVWFVLLWTLVLAVATALVVKFSTRYLLPVVPLWSVILAEMIDRARPQLADAWFRRLFFAAAACVALMAAGVAGADRQLGFLAVAMVAPLATLIVIVAVATFRGRGFESPPAVRLALILLMAVPILQLAVKPILEPEEAALIVARLDRHCSAGDAIDYIGKPALAGKIRVATNGQAKLKQLEFPDDAYCPHHAVVVVSENWRVDLSEYESIRFRAGIGSVDAQALCRAYARFELARFLQERRKEMILATRPKPAGEPRTETAEKPKPSRY